MPENKTDNRPKHFCVRNEDNINICKHCKAPRNDHPISFELYGGPVYIDTPDRPHTIYP